MRPLLALLIAAVLAGSTPVPATAAPPAGDEGQALLTAENERLRVLRALLRESRVPPAPPPPPSLVPATTACDADEARLVRVASAAELRRALRDARPGDLIAMADGVYRGRFVITAAGSAARPITLCGSRAAIIDAGSIGGGYGLHLTADHWALVGFTIRNGLKGLMADGAQHALIRGLEVHTIGHEGIHLRGFSADSTIERSWVHDVGLEDPELGEGVYIGSAVSNWADVTAGLADASDRNRVTDNLIGPDVTAEAVDIKEGSSDGIVGGNLVLLEGTQARAAMQIKGNGYDVHGNSGLATAGTPLVPAAMEIEAARGWGQDNSLRDNVVRSMDPAHLEPFRAPHGARGPATLVLPGRPVPYTLAELLTRFPSSFERLAPGVLLLKEHLLLTTGGRLTLRSGEPASELRLLSRAGGFVSLVGYHSELRFSGAAGRPLRLGSWDPAAGGPDITLSDGRAYLLVRGGRMDSEHGVFADLGFGLGQTSGVAWKGYRGEPSRGTVRASRFERNQFGAYTFEAVEMDWRDNLFIANLRYGFDPHDFSNRFVVEDNTAVANGSHGIIFSRGCSNNIIRRNRVIGNAGHGIFMDDGKVVADGDPRHARSVPSNDNLIEHNLVRGNTVGIVFEGGTGNIVHANRLDANQTGIRVSENARNNAFVANTIRHSSKLAMQLSSGSIFNRISSNQLAGGKGGIVIAGSPANWVQDNTVSDVVGRGVVLEGAAAGTHISGNRISGNGSQAIDLSGADGGELIRMAANDTSGWVVGRPLSPMEAMLVFLQRHPAVLVWTVVLLLPLVMQSVVRARLRRFGYSTRPAHLARSR